MNWKTHIDTAKPTKPVLKETGQTVEQIFERLSHGNSIEEILKAEPKLTKEHLRACFEYAKEIIPDWAKQRHSAGGAKLHVGKEDLTYAFRQHARAGKETCDKDDSALLLLVYAIECGLKRLRLKKLGYHSTAQFDDDELTHDLDALLKRLRGKPSFNNIKLDKRGQITAERLHEALRYGARLSERRKVVDTIKEILGWIEEEIG